MKGKIIDKPLIESIIRKNNDEFVDKVNKKVELILANAVNDLAQQVAYINLDNTILQPVNELLNGGFTDNSKFIYFLGIDSAQLELNTINSTNFWKELKNRIVSAWKNRKKRRRRRKKKKKDDEIPVYDFDPSKYNIYKLCEDLQTAVAKFSALSTIVYLEGNRIRIIGKEDYGVNSQIIIYPVIYNGDMFKFYLGKKKGFLDIDLKNRIAALEHKIEKAGDNFMDMIKVFNVLYYYANRNMPNQVFIESLLYSCPDELFQGENSYNVFVKIINYLTMSSIKNIPSLTNQDKTIFTDKISAASGLGYQKFMNQFVYLNENQVAKAGDRPSDKKPKKKFKLFKK